MSIKFSPSLKEVSEKIKKAMLLNEPILYKKISIYLDRWMQKNFKSEGGNVGGWKKLKAGGRYVGKGKNRRFDATAKILQNTGRLRASFFPAFSDSKKAGIGSDLPYAKIHNDGLGPIPQRRMLPKKEEIISDVVKISDLHIKSQLKEVSK